MLSTLTSYRVYTNDISKSLARIQASSTVQRDETYYEDNIGKVKTVDEFLSDQKLYTYALKAYGLSDQAASKGFIRKVIESDLSDSTSFANKLNDARYRDFASAFNFKTTTVSAQSAGQTADLVEAYSERSVRKSAAVAAKTSYFEQQIGEITSLDQLLDNTVFYEVILRSAGFQDPAMISKDFVKSVFTGVAGLPKAVAGITPLAAIAVPFNFDADGKLAPGTKALSQADVDQLIYRYNVETDNLSGIGSAARETAYYNDRIGKIDGASDITSDPRLFDYVMKAFGFDPSFETPEYMAAVLSDDPADKNGLLANLPILDPKSAAQTQANIIRKELLTRFNKVFEFAADGSSPIGKAQTAENIKATEDAYYNNYQALTNKKDAAAVSYFKLVISKAKSLVDLMVNDKAFGRDALDVALKAFDIDPKTASLTQIRRALESDVSDPDSYVNKLGDERYKNLAAAFNFDSNGQLRTERTIQSTAAQATTGQLYAVTFGAETTATQKDVIKADTKAYIEGVADIDSLGEFLKSGKTLNYALTAYGLGKETIDNTKLRKILTSDLGDPKSYVYTLKDTRYEKFAAAFNFKPDGTVRIESTGVQTDAKRLSTQNLYLLETLETQAGEMNEGTRLALFFLRKAPDIKSTLSLLADKALFEVVKTALGLPDSFSQVDIDKQVKTIEKKLKVADFQDKSKLDRFVARFAGLYDLKNNSGASAPVMGLFASEDTTTSLLARL